MTNLGIPDNGVRNTRKCWRRKCCLWPDSGSARFLLAVKWLILTWGVPLKDIRRPVTPVQSANCNK